MQLNNAFQHHHRRTSTRGELTITSASSCKRLEFSGTKQNIPPDLRAPITSDVERQLKQLVAQFGEKKVREALDPLITKCKWNDWQCVANAIRRIARKDGG